MSRILSNVHADARGLWDAGLLDDITMREIDALCLPPVKRYTAEDIRAIRAKARVSQAVFARCLNVGATTVQKWEQGLKSPGGGSSRLLQIVETRGIGVLLVEEVIETPDDTPPRLGRSTCFPHSVGNPISPALASRPPQWCSGGFSRNGAA